MSFTLTTKTAADIAAEELEAERAGMHAYRRAFNAHLATISPIGSLTATYPDATTMLELVEAHCATVPALAQARADITIYQRTHPDVESLRAAFGLSETEVDDMFRAAMALGED